MRRLVILPIAALCACDLISGPESTDPLSETALSNHVEFLAGDSLYGRASGTQYELQAAEYIRDEFMDYGLDPGVAGYLQGFSIDATETTEGLDAPSLQISSQNVLAVLHGTGDLAGQWVVLGAHYDHLGFNRVSDDSIVIYNGADDNASGTALLLELARYLSHYYGQGAGEDDHRRSVLFQAFGAEERGLLGSRHFMAYPTVPHDSIVAMVNLDMVGRLTNDVLIVGGSGSSPLWIGLLHSVNDQDLIYAYDDSGLHRSDQYPFLLANIPVLYFATGRHADYHQPSDDSRLINTAGMVRIGNVALDVLANLAEWPEGPEFVW